MGNPGDKVIKKAKIFFGTFLIILTITASLPVSNFAGHGKALYFLNSIKKIIIPVSQVPTSTPALFITSDPTPSSKPVATSSIKAVQKPLTTSRPCFRFKVTHLDGSTSNLCYSRSDIDALTDLGYKYSSAKTFYEFHLDGAGDYQAQYEITGSTIYLDAKKSQERQAESEKQKMNAIVGQMQEIEKRGY